MLKLLLHIGALLLIVLVKIILIVKKIFVLIFTYLFIPIRTILRLLFYKGVVKIYGYYLALFKRLGIYKSKTNIFSFVFSQKLVHVFVFLIVLILVFINISEKSRAGNIAYGATNTILAELIKSDFSASPDEEKLIIESFDQEATISTVQQTYLDNLSNFKPQPKVVMTAPDENEEEDEIMPTIQNGTSLVKPEIASTKISKKPRKETVVYTVEPGDTISTIAETYEVSVSTILWENNLSAYSIIRPGNKLTILPKSGLNHKVASGDNIGAIAKKYKIEENEILEANKLISSSKLTVGEKLFIPGGKKDPPPPPAPKTYTGFAAIKDLVKAPNANPVVGNKMNWPTVGHRITQYYSWRHYGLDIANKKGTAIYASDAGTIEYVGWGKGYGYQVVIDHGGGKKTRYAHLSEYHVEKGEKVSKGQTIAAMGSTGWSTGPHLHFEVIINGAKQNPLDYIR